MIEVHWEHDLLCLPWECTGVCDGIGLLVTPLLFTLGRGGSCFWYHFNSQIAYRLWVFTKYFITAAARMKSGIWDIVKLSWSILHSTIAMMSERFPCWSYLLMFVADRYFTDALLSFFLRYTTLFLLSGNEVVGLYMMNWKVKNLKITFHIFFFATIHLGRKSGIFSSSVCQCCYNLVANSQLMVIYTT